VTNTLAQVGNQIVKEQRQAVEGYGDQLLFYVKALAWAPRTIRRYKREVLNILAEVAFGAGGLTMIAGTVGVIAFMAFFAGSEVGIQGYASLSQIGVAKFSAFISAFFNTREVAPLISSIALAATVGCGYTARLGAMRISEEIDALEAMGVPSLPYLVTTRMIAGFLAVIPLYIVALCASYPARG
jgi:phospholipid/cholesterol/gamma-HCH transport system permease protein